MPVPSITNPHRTPMVRRTAGMAGAPLDGQTFTPDQLPNLGAWFRADALTTLAYGTAVASWPDSSGKGRTLAQAASANQPTLMAGVTNQPVVRFNGSSTYMDCATFGVALAQPNTVFLVCTLPAKNQQVPFGTIGAANGNLIFVPGSGNNHPILYAGTNLQMTASIPIGLSVFSLIYNGAASAVYLNGSKDTSGNGGAQTFAALRVGNTSDLSAYWFSGDLAELIVYNALLATNDRWTVEAYLSAKYGIAMASS